MPFFRPPPHSDFDYRVQNGNPDQWMEGFENYFGRDMPLFATIGNHDSCMWFEGGSVANGRAWETVLSERYARLGQDQYCEGTVGIMNSCYYKGLFMVESGLGELSGRDDASYVGYLDEVLAARINAPWKLCSWHKNQRELQMCSKNDEAGYAAYESCRKAGAMVNNAHEHSYARSHTMNDLSSSEALYGGVDNFENDVTLGFGKNFVFVQGLAGSSIRNECSGFGSRPWWASWAAGNGNKGSFGNPNQGSSYGYMACTFKPGGVANRADCFFEDVNGNRFDEYSIYSEIGFGPAPSPPPTAPTPAPAPTPSAPCTPRNSDPWQSGSFVPCCAGTESVLNNWDGGSNYYYRCVAV
jgi:hypothetical protein